MKETLQTRYEGRYLEPLLNNNEPLNEKKHRKLLKEIHTNKVSDALLSFENSPVLDERAPKISTDEPKLPRSTRRTLAQLRSGYSKSLNSYRHRIDSSVSEFCPDCNSSPIQPNIFSTLTSTRRPSIQSTYGSNLRRQRRFLTAPQPSNPTTNRRNPTGNNNNKN